MGRFFTDDFLDEMALLAPAAAPLGAADIGDVVAVANAVGDGGDDEFFEAWDAAAQRQFDAAREQAAGGHRVSAHQSALRAATYWSISYRPLYGAPVDPRLARAFKAETEAFALAAENARTPAEQVSIPFGDTPLPGYFVPAEGAAGERRPLLIATNGYDATLSALYSHVAKGASERGYHCLIFDGPGQGSMLVEHEVHMRPDWEAVITPVVDFALARDDVDPDKVALTGWSLGGYLALRAVSAEHRIAAVIADPALRGIVEGSRERMKAMGMPEEMANQFPDFDKDMLEAVIKGMTTARGARWASVQRGLWVHGLDSMEKYVMDIKRYTLEGRIQDIKCRTLVCAADADPLSMTAKSVYDELQCPKDFIEFTAAEGAGDHCEFLNRTLWQRRAFDWLDSVFA
jgi:pimeloyl-ACP methyl ester carboxylesterase